MLFNVDVDNNKMTKHKSSWEPEELKLENYIITTSEGSDVKVLDFSVFGEDLLFISNQVRTRNKKRADILALDRGGNAVIVELKRGVGFLGVETQALQYLADFSSYKGIDFVKHFSKKRQKLEENIHSFIGDDVKIEDLNKSSRIILVARQFDPTIFSMGEWLSNKGVAFRCIEYSPLKIGTQHFISFSVVFDRSSESMYALSFNSSAREPGIFWHNIAFADDDWWKYLVQEEQIPACFENGERGAILLKKYIKGDRVIAYAKGYGAIGWGVIDDPSSYRLIDEGDSGDLRNGDCRHRLNIKWKVTASNLNEGLEANVIRNQFEIYHPVSTSVSIGHEKGERLMEKLNKKFQ